MNPGYLRIRWPLQEAMARYGRWLGLPEVAAPQPVADRGAIDPALADGAWRGLAVHVFRSDPWTVFDADVNVGTLPEEAQERFAGWIDPAAWVDDDEEQLTGREQGWLWIHRAA